MNDQPPFLGKLLCAGGWNKPITHTPARPQCRKATLLTPSLRRPDGVIRDCACDFNLYKMVLVRGHRWRPRPAKSALPESGERLSELSPFESDFATPINAEQPGNTHGNVRSLKPLNAFLQVAVRHGCPCPKSNVFGP